MRKDGHSFFHKGSNKRWEGVLKGEWVAVYDSLTKNEFGAI
jgi:hypothetical protein|tara:strand:- start:1140 stop:1262 length:123 start_codon:yes stop_codon:yes gene_type:complete